jgi:hypothetical protein
MKGRKGRGTGGVNEAEEDVKDKPEARTNAKNIDEEAEERKSGGRAKRKHGGKMIGKVEGEKSAHHAGRKPRKAGGRTSGSDGNPFTSARKGKDAPGREIMKGEMGMGED